MLSNVIFSQVIHTRRVARSHDQRIENLRNRLDVRQEREDRKQDPDRRHQPRPRPLSLVTRRLVKPIDVLLEQRQARQRPERQPRRRRRIAVALNQRERTHESAACREHERQVWPPGRTARDAFLRRQRIERDAQRKAHVLLRHRVGDLGVDDARDDTRGA